jgi:hypothetical protein
METPILLPILTAVAALLGVGLTSFVQLKNQRSNQAFQQRNEEIKHQRERTARDSDATLQRLVAAHKLISKVAREFSITNVDVVWRSKVSDTEYDMRYLAACLEMDELRAFADLYEKSMSEDMEEMSNQMNIFWGNFKLALQQTASGKSVEEMIPCLTCTHDAATKIGRISFALKARIAHRVEALQSGI